MAESEYSETNEGQRFEVRCNDENWEDVSVGYTTHADGGALIFGALLQPDFYLPYVVDHGHVVRTAGVGVRCCS